MSSLREPRLDPRAVTAVLSDLSTVCAGPLAWREPVMLAWLLLAAPLLEEWVLRAGLQEWLLRRATNHAALASILVASLVFFGLHLGRGAITSAMTLPMSLALGALYSSQRQWWVCAALHAGSNAVMWRLCLLTSL